MDRVRIKRVYDAPDPADGYRVLVDRLWPRGVSRDRAALDEWAKGVAPSPALRTWWNHDPARMDEFARRYRAELDAEPAVDDELDVVSPTSPLGRAVSGRYVGDTVTFTGPTRQQEVAVVAAVPYA